MMKMDVLLLKYVNIVYCVLVATASWWQQWPNKMVYPPLILMLLLLYIAIVVKN